MYLNELFKWIGRNHKQTMCLRVTCMLAIVDLSKRSVCRVLRLCIRFEPVELISFTRLNWRQWSISRWLMSNRWRARTESINVFVFAPWSQCEFRMCARDLLSAINLRSFVSSIWFFTIIIKIDGKCHDFDGFFFPQEVSCTRWLRRPAKHPMRLNDYDDNDD